MHKNKRTAFAFYAVALTFAITMMGTTMPTPIYPVYQAELGFSQLTITVVYAVYALGVIAALLLTGNWSDQIGRRPMLVLGLGFSMLSSVVFIWGGGLSQILLGRMLSGVSAGIFTGTATVAVVELEPKGRQDWATLIATAVNMGGLGFGPLFAGFVVKLLPAPMQMAYALHFILALLAILAVWLAPETAQKPAKPKLSIRKPSLPAAVVKVFIPAAIAAFAAFAVFGMLTALTPAILSEVLHINNSVLTGFLVFTLFISSIIGQGLQSHIPAKQRMVVGCMVLIIGMVLLILALHSAWLLLLMASGVVAGIGQGIVFKTGIAAVTLASPANERAAVASSFFLVAYVAISLPVIGFGLLARVSNLVTAGTIFSSIIMALALASTAILWRWQ